MKSKTTAGILAIFVGWLGIHHFYLGNKSKGLLYLIIQVSCFFGAFIIGPLLLSIMGIGALIMGLSWIVSVLLGVIGFIEGIVLLCKDQNDFDIKYNDGISSVYTGQYQHAAPQQPQAAPRQQAETDGGNKSKSKAEQLVDLKKLLDNGVLTQEEFDDEKRKILNS